MSRAGHSYEQTQKVQARQEALAEAVAQLTEGRGRAATVRQSYVREARDQLMRQGSYDQEQVEQLDEGDIRAWEQFHASQVSNRTAGELRVAYLAGPNPMADFEVLTAMGVHPHNIWAFETDKKAFAAARERVASSAFRQLKLINENIEEFFQNVPQEFDLIYLDACGALPSSQRTLRALATAMANQRLASPGVVLTNFASPFSDGHSGSTPYSDFVGAYLYPKTFLCGIDPTDPAAGFSEGALCHGLTGEDFLSVVTQNPEYFYSQYITRQLMDLALVVTPARRVANSRSWGRLFKYGVAEMQEQVVGQDPDFYASLTDEAPLSVSHDSLFGGPAEEHMGLLEVPKVAKNWRTGISGLPAASHSGIEAAMAIETSRLSNGSAWSDELASAVRDSLASRMFQFCDVVLASTVVDPMLHQVGYPYHYSPRNIRRWLYKAKTNRMFMDMFVLDTCRYVYDWLPSVHLLQEGFSDISQQLVFRLALDGLAKARRWYNPDVLSGTAVIGQTTAGFAAEVLPARREIS